MYPFGAITFGVLGHIARGFWKIGTAALPSALYFAAAHAEMSHVGGIVFSYVLSHTCAVIVDTLQMYELRFLLKVRTLTSHRPWKSALHSF